MNSLKSHSTKQNCQNASCSPPLMLCTLAIEKLEIWKCLLKIQGAISRTMGPILGLFVLILNAYYMLNQNITMKIEFLFIFFLKFENFDLSCALDISMKRVTNGWLPGENPWFLAGVLDTRTSTGQSDLHTVLPSHMEGSYCTSGYSCLWAQQTVSWCVYCLFHVNLLQGHVYVIV